MSIMANKSGNNYYIHDTAVLQWQLNKMYLKIIDCCCCPFKWHGMAPPDN